MCGPARGGARKDRTWPIRQTRSSSRGPRYGRHPSRVTPLPRQVWATAPPVVPRTKAVPMISAIIVFMCSHLRSGSVRSTILAMRSPCAFRIHDADDITTTEIADAARLAADPDRRARHREHILFRFPPETSSTRRFASANSIAPRRTFTSPPRATLTPGRGRVTSSCRLTPRTGACRLWSIPSSMTAATAAPKRDNNRNQTSSAIPHRRTSSSALHPLETDPSPDGRRSRGLALQPGCHRAVPRSTRRESRS